MKRIVVIDGQGGKMGRMLIESIRERAVSLGAEITVTAVGTNTIATSNMLKADPDQAATGENAIVVAARRADAICGPLGIVIADAMNGEITARAAAAVGAADAIRILLPMNKCENVVVGVANISFGEMIEEAAACVLEEC